MSVLKLAESVHHLLFEVGSNLLDHLVNGGGLVVFTSGGTFSCGGSHGVGACGVGDDEGGFGLGDCRNC
jgi:hypothetical protein